MRYLLDAVDFDSISRKQCSDCSLLSSLSLSSLFSHELSSNRFWLQIFYGIVLLWNFFSTTETRKSLKNLFEANYEFFFDAKVKREKQHAKSMFYDCRNLINSSFNLVRRHFANFVEKCADAIFFVATIVQVAYQFNSLFVSKLFEKSIDSLHNWYRLFDVIQRELR